MNTIKVGIEQITALHWAEFIDNLAEGNIHINENGEMYLPRIEAVRYCGEHVEYLIDNTTEGDAA